MQCCQADSRIGFQLQHSHQGHTGHPSDRKVRLLLVNISKPQLRSQKPGQWCRPVISHKSPVPLLGRTLAGGEGIPVLWLADSGCWRTRCADVVTKHLHLEPYMVRLVDASKISASLVVSEGGPSPG